MPEISIAGASVPLVYYDTEAPTITAIKKFPPLVDWIAAFRPPAGVTVDEIRIQNIDWISKRIEGIKMQVQLRSSAGNVVHRQSLQLSVAAPNTNTDEARVQTVVLPILTKGGHEHIILRTHTPVSLATPITTAISGVVTTANEFVGRDAQQLGDKGVKIRAADFTVVGKGPYHCGTEGSANVVKFAVFGVNEGAAQEFPIVVSDTEKYELVKLSDCELVGEVTSEGSQRRRISDASALVGLLLYQQHKRGAGRAN